MRAAPLAVLAALSLLALPTAAFAGTAKASGSITFHAGPGSDYRVLGNLRNGERYEVEECTRESRWCLVSDSGDILGWVRGSYLVGTPAKMAVTPSDFLRWPAFDGFPPDNND